MALFRWRNRETGEVKESLRELDPRLWEKLIEAPHSKFLEMPDKVNGKSRLKDMQGILKARARNHARDHDLDDNIAFNREHGREAHVRAGLLNENGKRRTKLDDL